MQTKADPNTKLRTRTRRVVLLLLAAGILTGVLGLSLLVGHRIYYQPSEGMFPTLRRGDRFLAEVLLSPGAGPRRGELWLFRAPRHVSPNESIHVKRVVAIPGDTVEIVPNRWMVDGKPALALERTTPLSTIDSQEVGPTQIVSVARLRYGYPGQDLLIAAVPPGLAVRRQGGFVRVGGRVLLRASPSQLQVRRGLAELGGLPDLEAMVYAVDAEPVLVIVRGARLVMDPGHLVVNGGRMPEPYLVEPPAYRVPPRTMATNEYFVLGDKRNDSNDSHSWGPVTRDRFVGQAVCRIWPPGRIGAL